jgi:hypothetical protein
LFHTDEVFGFLGQGCVDRQVIDLGEHFGDGLNFFDAQFGCLFVREERVEGDDAHAEGLASQSDFTADASEADHA